MAEKKNSSARTALDENSLESVAGGRGHYEITGTDDGNFLVSVTQRQGSDINGYDEKFLLKETFSTESDAKSFGQLASKAIDIKEKEG